MANITIDGSPWTVEACRSCSAPIVWAVTLNGNRMPVDAEPAEDGNVALETRGEGRPPLARVLTTTQRFGRTGLRRSHYSTCPQGSMWRRRGRPAGGV